MQSAKINRVAAKALPSAPKRPNLALVEMQRKEREAERPRVLDSRRRKRPKLFQVARSIDVFDAGGFHVRTYSVVLGANCLAAEYEEYALIMAERDGVLAGEAMETCWARCDD
jgi:hypothetical protein